MTEGEKYLAIVNIHGRCKLEETDSPEAAAEFIKVESELAYQNFPYFPEFSGRIMRVDEVLSISFPNPNCKSTPSEGELT